MAKNLFVKLLAAIALCAVVLSCSSTSNSTEGVDGDSEITDNEGDSDTTGHECEVANETTCIEGWVAMCVSYNWTRVVQCVGDTTCQAGACVVADGDTTDEESEVVDTTDGDVDSESEVELDDESETIIEDGDSESDTASEDGDTTDDDTDVVEDGDTDSETDSESDAITEDGDTTDDETETTIDGDEESEITDTTDGDEESEIDGDSDTTTEVIDGDSESEEVIDGVVENETETESDSESEVLPDCTPGPCCQDGNWIPAGQPCTSGQDALDCTTDTCGENHTCLHTLMGNGCLIENACVAAGTVNGPCLKCTALSKTSWTLLYGNVCNDGSDCTYNDRCDSLGECKGTDVTCPSNTECTTFTCDGTSECVASDTGACVDGDSDSESESEAESEIPSGCTSNEDCAESDTDSDYHTKGVCNTSTDKCSVEVKCNPGGGFTTPDVDVFLLVWRCSYYNATGSTRVANVPNLTANMSVLYPDGACYGGCMNNGGNMLELGPCFGVDDDEQSWYGELNCASTQTLSRPELVTGNVCSAWKAECHLR